MKVQSLLLSLVLSLSLAACGQQDKPAEVTQPVEPAAPEVTTEAAPVEAAAVGTVPDAASPPAGMDAEMDTDVLYASKCSSCHGETGEGLADNPKLIGLSKADIASRLKDYRDGKQMGPKTAVMAAMAKPLTDAQITSLADYLGH